MLEILKVIILLITHTAALFAGLFLAAYGWYVKEKDAVKSGTVNLCGKIYEIKEKRAEA